ncbi:serine protease inhibitor [Lachnospiraceae bacterium JC7]|nr:serine protease inhibitor [Lachnospiraceae bacterium JC7]
MKKRILTALIALSVVSSVISGCGTTDIPISTDTSVTETENSTPKESPADNTLTSVSKLPEADINMDFNSSLIEFIENYGFQDKNYMISPTSFRAALALAVSGADNDTKSELLKVMGFNDMDELNAWYKSVTASIDSYDEWLQNARKQFEENREYYGDEAEAPDGAFDLQNSIWRNTKSSGELSKEYIKYVEETFGAKADNVSEDKITEKVNSWINENTNGLIPSISNDLSYADLILVNTLYLRTAWVNEFYDYATREGNFQTLAGNIVKKDFMKQQERFRYYEDEKGKFVVLPMKGGINAVFILGDVDDIIKKIPAASYEEVAVCLPKFETETELSDNQLLSFCKAQGAMKAFTPDADFSIMSHEMSLMITDIIQKTKIKVDEKGIEAAAATAILMLEGCAPDEEHEIKEFIADRPFRYMLLTDTAEPELLFYGQIVE